MNQTICGHKMQNKVVPKNKSGKPDDKKAVTVLSDASVSGAPNYVCVLCCSNITGREHVKCDICDGVFHIDCTGIPDGAKITFLQIAESVGWTCNSCRITARINIHKFQAGLSELTETVAGLKNELNELKNSVGIEVVNHGVDADVSARRTDDARSEHNDNIRTVVHKTLRDNDRRKSNVVITGLPEDDNVDDADLFCRFMSE